MSDERIYDDVEDLYRICKQYAVGVCNVEIKQWNEVGDYSPIAATRYFGIDD